MLMFTSEIPTLVSTQSLALESHIGCGALSNVYYLWTSFHPNPYFKQILQSFVSRNYVLMISK